MKYFDSDGIQMHLGDCREILSTLPDCTVNTCVTSPPYYGLRDYGDKNQIGLEESPDLYVEKMVSVFREVRRLLRDDGTLWLNLGDSYNNYRPGSYSDDRAHAFGGERSSGKKRGMPDDPMASKRGLKLSGLKEKDLIGIPWRVAFALQADGWFLRQDIIWAKPNPMPESVRDRCTKSHEYIFLLSKSERYHFDHEAIKEPAVCGHLPGNNSHRGEAEYDKGDKRHRTKKGLVAYSKKVRESAAKGSFNGKTEAMAETGQNAFRAVVDKRNKRSVWNVPVKPYKGAHFAVYPQELIRPCILAGCPIGGVVLDPFLGSGTTAEVAINCGCRFVGCELNRSYLDLAVRRFIQRRLVFE